MALNFPVGDLVQKLVPVSDFGLNRVLELQKGAFSGYAVATIEGVTGIEEGVLFFLDGKVVGSAYTLDNADIVSFGNVALPLFFNCLAAPFGVVDVVSLSRQQIELILALEEKIQAEESRQGLRSLWNSKYDSSKVSKLLPSKSGRSEGQPKTELIESLGIGDIFK